MEIQDLAKQYQTKSDDELLRLALDSEQLTSAAAAVLNSELAKRQIGGTEQLNAFHHLGNIARSNWVEIPDHDSFFILTGLDVSVSEELSTAIVPKRALSGFEQQYPSCCSGFR
jgi:hypothetical protein